MCLPTPRQNFSQLQPIDEVELIETTFAVKELRELLRYLYTEQICKQFDILLASTGHGKKCQHQRFGITSKCCFHDTKTLHYSQLMGFAESSVNHTKLRELYEEAASCLSLNFVLVDFDETLTEYLSWFVATDFADTQVFLEVSQDFIRAKEYALFKLQLKK